jgi:hypothetical protein
MAIGSSGSFVLRRCARRGGCPSGAASSSITLQIGGLSPCVPSQAGDGMGASLLVTAAAGLSTNSLRNQVGFSVPPFLMVCFPSWACLRSVRWGSGGLVASDLCPSGKVMAGGHLQRPQRSAALWYADAIDLLLLVLIKNYVP